MDTEDTAPQHIPSLAGPFHSFVEFQTAQKKYEEFHGVQLNRYNSKTLEAYKKKCPSRPMNMDLKYQSFTLQCVQFGSYSSQGTGQKSTSSIKTGCPFLFRFTLSVDGENLILCSSNTNHNHELSKVSTCDICVCY